MASCTVTTRIKHKRTPNLPFGHVETFGLHYEFPNLSQQVLPFRLYQNWAFPSCNPYVILAQFFTLYQYSLVCCKCPIALPLAKYNTKHSMFLIAELIILSHPIRDICFLISQPSPLQKINTFAPFRFTLYFPPFSP